MNRKFLKNLIREEINKADPIGLISMGAPRDEYGSEAEEIMLTIGTCRTEKDLEGLIYKTFVRMFDKRIAGSREIYRELSSRIFNRISV